MSIEIESGLPNSMFQTGAGHETSLDEKQRRSTGSHYTEIDLAIEIVRASFEPVFAAAWSRANGQVAAYKQEILNLKVLDPAMGAGHLLLVSVIELAREIAFAEREGKPKPPPYYEYITDPTAWTNMRDRAWLDVRVTELLPDCVTCIYGVDLLPETVAIAKAIFKLLTGTEARNLRCGNSLFGSTKVEAEAFMPDDFDAMFGQMPATSGDPWDEAFYASYGSREPVNPFHWEREFPSVKFDVVVANPPFVGDRRLRGVVGESGVRYLSRRYSSGAVLDLCGYFVLKIDEWLHETRGVAGLITTKSIAQGKNRVKALLPLVGGVSPKFEIFRSCRSREWPGLASVHIATIHMRRAGQSALAVDPRRIVQIAASAEDSTGDDDDE